MEQPGVVDASKEYWENPSETDSSSGCDSEKETKDNILDDTRKRKRQEAMPKREEWKSIKLESLIETSNDEMNLKRFKNVCGDLHAAQSKLISIILEVAKNQCNVDLTKFETTPREEVMLAIFINCVYTTASGLMFNAQRVEDELRAHLKSPCLKYTFKHDGLGGKAWLPCRVRVPAEPFYVSEHRRRMNLADQQTNQAPRAKHVFLQEIENQLRCRPVKDDHPSPFNLCGIFMEFGTPHFSLEYLYFS